MTDRDPLPRNGETMTTSLADQFEALSKAATQGEVFVGCTTNEGAFGSGPDAQHGFASYELHDSKDRSLLDTLNSDTAEVHVEHEDDGSFAWDKVGHDNLRFIQWCFNNRAAISSALTSTPPVQEGWVLVPREPSVAMVERGREQLSQGDAKVQTHARVMWVWEAMTAAAPETTGVLPTGERT